MIVYRTAAGRAVVTHPYCPPHLGAHLGRGGRVEGETLQWTACEILPEGGEATSW